MTANTLANFVIGNLYQVKEFFWYLYPSWKQAKNNDVAFAGSMNDAKINSKYLNVTFVGVNDIFVPLEFNDDYCKIVTTDGKVGWIIIGINLMDSDSDWYLNCFRELKKQNVNP